MCKDGGMYMLKTKDGGIYENLFPRMKIVKLNYFA